MLQHLLSVPFPTGFGLLLFHISCYLGTTWLDAWFSNVRSSTYHGSAPCLLVLSPLLLFSRLNGSGEALGRKKTDFFQRPVLSPSCLSLLPDSAAASHLVFRVGDTPAPLALLIFLWLLILSVCMKDLAGSGHLGPSRLWCLADEAVLNFP